METLSNMESVCGRLRNEIDDLNRAMLAMPSSAELLNDIRRLLSTEQDVVMNDAEPVPVQRQEFSKPNSPRTPNGLKRNQFDFDAFPHTPTLEQLGISDNTLAIVGEARNKSKLAQASDSDSDYRLSPSASIALSLVNTIPSTIPLF